MTIQKFDYDYSIYDSRGRRVSAGSGEAATRYEAVDRIARAIRELGDDDCDHVSLNISAVREKSR